MLPFLFLVVAFHYGNCQTPIPVTAAQQQQIVDQHNSLRRSISTTNTLKLSWDADVAAQAQAWANQCTETHPAPGSSYMQTTKFPSLGQNLYMFGGTQGSWQNAIQGWYNEISGFTYGQAPAANTMVGHYTQVVWWSTYVVGCGAAYCPNAQFQYYYVCNYGPAGNIGPDPNTYKPYTKGTACAACPNSCDNGLCTNPCPYQDAYSNCGDYADFCSDPSWSPNCPATCNCAASGQIYYVPPS